MFDRVETQLYKSEVFRKFFGKVDENATNECGQPIKFSAWVQGLQTNQNENDPELTSKNLYKKHINKEVILEKGDLDEIDYDCEVLTYLFNQTILSLSPNEKDDIIGHLNKKSLNTFRESDDSKVIEKICTIAYGALSALDAAKALMTFSITFAVCCKLVYQIAMPILFGSLTLVAPHLPIRFVAVIVSINHWKMLFPCGLFMVSCLTQKASPALIKYVITPLQYFVRYTFSIKFTVCIRITCFSYSVAKYFVPDLHFVSQRVRLCLKKFYADYSIGDEMVWLRQQWIDKLLMKKAFKLVE